MKALNHLLFTGALLCSSFVFAQDFSSQIVEVDNSSANHANHELANLVLLAEQLSQEVRELRGIVEQQSYELRKLQQQRLDDYRSIDKRIAGLSAGQTPHVNNPNISQETITQPAVAAVSSVEQAVLSEKEAYRAAYGLVKKRDFENAVTSFNSFLQDYPSGTYAGNAYYWLGELYVLENDYTNAQMSMQALIAQFPEHRKVPDAHYKLAKIFHQLGDPESAKSHANIVISQYANKSATTVQLTKEFLTKNYP